MLVLNKETQTIQNIEELTFEHTVKPIFKNHFDFIFFNDFNEENGSIKAFIDHVQENGGELTDEEKVEILEKIIEEYDWRSNDPRDVTSIFDEDMIGDCVKDWIEEQCNAKIF